MEFPCLECWHNWCRILTNANWWAVGGGGTGAKGTVTTSGSFTVTAGGSGYSSKPQIVISGGGWRYETDTAPQGDQTLGGSEGILFEGEAVEVQ